MNDLKLEAEIKKANREVYNRITPEEYNKNESIFNEARAKAIDEHISNLALASGSDSFLDVGCGSGHILKTAARRFKFCVGVDISENLLAQIQSDYPKCFLAASDAEFLPFRSESFNCISCYALLHHLFRHEKLFRECHRTLKESGSFYTDHDPNYYFNRFYHLLYKVRFAGKHGFGSATEDLAEYHNSCSPGINPEKLKKTLLDIGFREVKITYRTTDRENWGASAKAAIKVLKFLGGVVPAKSFFTHFSITATK